MGSLSNHGDDGHAQERRNFAYLTIKNNSFARFARANSKLHFHLTSCLLKLPNYIFQNVTLQFAVRRSKTRAYNS